MLLWKQQLFIVHEFVLKEKSVVHSHEDFIQQKNNYCVKMVVDMSIYKEARGKERHFSQFQYSYK